MEGAIIVLWVGLGYVAALIAKGKGRSGIGFFLLSLILTPFVGLLSALAARPLEEKRRKHPSGS